MKTPDQVYKTHISASAQAVWNAITNPEFTRQYWFGNANISPRWETGGTWQHQGMESGTVYHTGIIEECIPNQRLVITWSNPDDEADISRVTFIIDAVGEGVELTVLHGDFIDGSEMATHVSGGWPSVIGNMKEFLETGQVTTLDAPCGAAHG